MSCDNPEGINNNIIIGLNFKAMPKYFVFQYDSPSNSSFETAIIDLYDAQLFKRASCVSNPTTSPLSKKIILSAKPTLLKRCETRITILSLNIVLMS